MAPKRLSDLSSGIMVEMSGFTQGGEVHIRNLKNKLKEIASMGDGEIVLRVERAPEIKNQEQIRYFWGEVAVKLLAGLRNTGLRIPSKEAAVQDIKEEMGFVRRVYDEYGDLVSEELMSIKEANKEELRIFTRDLIEFIVTELHVEVLTPDEWKRSEKLTSNNL